MTTRGVINSNFYQIVDVDVDGNPTQIKAGYVDAANVSNLGNIATINLDGSSSNVLYGNGIFAPGGGGYGGSFIANGFSNVAIPTANGNVTVVAGTPATGLSLWSFEVDGNLMLASGNSLLAGGGRLGNPLGEVYTGVVGLQAGNGSPSSYAMLISNNSSQYVRVDNNSVVLSTNQPGAPNNWEFRNDGNTDFPVTKSVNLGNSATANFFIGDGSLLSNINGGNISNVANANYANFAGNALVSGTVYTNSQPNITSVGTLTGLTVSGANVNMSTYWINNVGYPSANSDAATKEYVDILASTGISFHEAVNAATNTTLAIATSGTTAYVQPNGAGNGIGAYISTTGTFTTIDTENIAVANSRILVKNESNASWNGIYNYTNATAITRSSDADTYGLNNDLKLSLNDYFFTTGGNVNKGTAFIVNEPVGTIIFGTSNIGFAVFSTGLVYTGGTGINVSGTVISISNTTVSNGTYGNGDSVATFTVNDQGQLTAASNTVITANAANLTGTTLNATIVNSSLTSVGTLTTLDVTGNISAGNANLGNLTTSNFFSGNGSLLTGVTSVSANTANTVTNNNQPNITSLGNLTSLTVSGNLNAGNADLGNLATASYFTGNGSLLTSITGANVSGQVSNSLVAGTVYTNSQPNITSVGTLTSLSVSGNITSDNINGGNLVVANYISGNGSLLTSIAGANVTGQVGNALVAGTVYTNAQPNITSVGTLTSLDITGNVTSGNANLGNATTSNYFIGNGAFLTGVVVSNAATAVTVTGNAQPNITSVGALSNLTVSGNINSNNIISSNIISANSFFATTQSTATSPGGSLSLTYLSPQNQRFTGSSIFDVVLPDPSTLTTGAVWYINNDSSNNIIVKNYAGTTLYTVLPGANTKFIYTGSSNWDYHSYLPNSMSASSTTANLANLVIANYFSGNGSLLTGITSSGGNANYANFAGQVIDATQSNITTLGTLTDTTLGASNSFTGGNLVSANFVTGTVTTGAQPNITSIGNLTSLTVNGNITGSNNLALYGNGGALTANISVTNYYTTTTNAFNFGFAQSRGTRTSPANVIVGDDIFAFTTAVYTGNGTATWDGTVGWKTIFPIRSTITSQPTGSNVWYGSNIRFTTSNAVGNTTYVSTFDDAGGFTIPGNLNAANIIGIGNLTSLAVSGNSNLTSLAVSGNSNLTTTNFTQYFYEKTNNNGSVSGTITPGGTGAGTIQSYTLTGSITMNAFNGAIAGQSMTIILTQGGSGSYTLTSTWKFSGGSKTLSTAVGAVDIIFAFYDGTTYYATLNKGYV